MVLCTVFSYEKTYNDYEKKLLTIKSIIMIVLRSTVMEYESHGDHLKDIECAYEKAEYK